MINESKKFESLPGSENVTSLNKKSIRRVLGIDPGLANTGFGIVDYIDSRYHILSI